jgi:hypothetical protein
MPTQCVPSLLRLGSIVVFASMLACCTPGGQFDPTEVINSDIFNTKKKLAGEREPVFPNGVPGAETGVPPDLVKGYQPPPGQPVAVEPAVPAGKAATKTAEVTAEKPRAKPKAKPKPKVASTPSASTSNNDPAWNQKAAQPAQSAWPAPAGQQPAQTNWPAAPGAQATQSAGSSQTNWPAAQQAAPAGQQSVWPNPPAPGTYSH